MQDTSGIRTTGIDCRGHIIFETDNKANILAGQDASDGNSLLQQEEQEQEQEQEQADLFVNGSWTALKEVCLSLGVWVACAPLPTSLEVYLMNRVHCVNWVNCVNCVNWNV